MGVLLEVMAAMTFPLVSVIIPSFNHERYLKPCIESVRAQSNPELEIVIVDDGSCDNTVGIARSYKGAVTLIDQPNLGTQAARNTAINASSGKYVALLDSDDLWYSTKLEKQLAVMENSPDVGLVYSLAHIFATDNAPNEHSPILGRPLSTGVPALHQLLIRNPIPALTAVFRRSCIERSGPFDVGLVGAGDYDMWIRIAAQWEVRCVPEVLAAYRVHSSNTTGMLRKSKRAVMERQRVIERALVNYAHLIPGEIANKAHAETYMLEAECSLVAGDLATASMCIAEALILDPSLGEEDELLLSRLSGWISTTLPSNYSATMLAHFVDDLFSDLGDHSDHRRILKNQVLAQNAMRQVFLRFGEGRRAGLFNLAMLGMRAQPKWIRNRGAWSIAIRSLATELTCRSRNES